MIERETGSYCMSARKARRPREVSTMTMSRRFFLLGLIVLAGLANPPRPQTGEDDQGPAGVREPGILKLKRLSCTDKQGTGKEAFSMLIPADWQFDGGIRWSLENPAMPAVAAFSVSSPDGKSVFEVFPNQAFFWTNNSMLLSLFPIGSRYFGSEVRPPVGPVEALKAIVLPRFRQNVPSKKIVKEEMLPDLAKALGAGASSQQGISTNAAGARIRVEYLKAGQPVEEEIYGVVESMSFPIQSMTGTVTNTNWYVDYVFSFRAQRGDLDSQARTFRTIVSSFRVNPQWFNTYNQVVQYLIQAQIRKIKNVGELSRIISRTHNEISSMMMDSYNQRQQVYDKISDDFSQYVRGVDKYYNPLEGKEVELPTGYDNVWTNNLGEYVLSEDPNFNPNVGSNLNWQQMQKGN